MPVPTVSLSLQPTDAEISPLLFGHFIEFIENCIQGGVTDSGSPASSETGIRLDVLEKAEKLHPAILRFPGGTYANIYHWMDGIGPVSSRRKRRNLIWGGINGNAFGTAEFVSYCRKLGAEPMLCVNMASGTAQEAADWVEYCNGEPGTYYADLRVADGFPEPFHVKYWCIGNECYAEPDLGPQHEPLRYVSDAWEFTKHMKLMDPSLKLIYVGNPLDQEWNSTVLESLAPVCDYFSIHHYSSEGARGPYGPFASLQEFRSQLDTLIPLLHASSVSGKKLSPWYRFPGRETKIRLAIDEWNIWDSTPRGKDNPYGLKMVYTWRDALWTACMLNTFVEYAEDIGIANLAQMVNVLAPIVTSGDTSFVQTTYHVLLFYRKYLQGRKVQCSFSAPPLSAGPAGTLSMLNASACLKTDGTICAFLVNLSQDLPLDVTFSENYCMLESEVLSAPSFSAFNTPECDVIVHSSCANPQETIHLGPASVCAVCLSPAGASDTVAQAAAMG